MSVVIMGMDSLLSGLGTAKTMAEPIISQAAMEAALAVRRKAIDKVPRRTGELQRSIVADPLPFGAMVSVQEKYGIYVEQGTGLYGPYHKRIEGHPYLAWDDVVVRSTAGMKAQPFFWPSVEEELPEAYGIFALARDKIGAMSLGISA